MLNALSSIKEKLSADITEIPEVLKSKHLPGLDGMRGICILMVIVGHLCMNSRYTDFINGNLGVIIFFVISGFLITTLLLKEKVSTGSISLKKFYFRRILRIIPVAYLFLVVLIILNHSLRLNIPARGFLGSALMVQNLPIVSTYNWYIEHFWSLSVEEQFYLVFPFLLAFNVNGYIKTVIVLIVLVSAIELLGFNKVGVFYTNHVIHIVAFIIINVLGNSVHILIGSLLSLLLFKKVIVIKNSSLLKYFSLALFVLAFVFSLKGSPLWVPYFQLFAFPLIIGTVLLLNLNPNSFFTRILSIRPLVYLGRLSYSLYIWQQLFSNNQTWLINSDSVLLHLAVLFAIANFSYFFYERLFLKLKDRFKVRWQLSAQ